MFVKSHRETRALHAFELSKVQLERETLKLFSMSVYTRFGNGDRFFKRSKRAATDSASSSRGSRSASKSPRRCASSAKRSPDAPGGPRSRIRRFVQVVFKRATRSFFTNPCERPIRHTTKSTLRVFPSSNEPLDRPKSLRPSLTHSQKTPADFEEKKATFWG